MHSATSKTPPFFMTIPSKLTNPKPRHIQFKFTKQNHRKFSFKPLQFIQNSNSNLESLSSSLIPTSQNPNSLLFCPSLTAKKLQSLASEFKALPEPIDRVKRLLIYASHLPPFDESDRLESNRVMGCTTQVWLEVKMDSKGLMRFRADSDSEITKGFCSCLIWVLDTAAPEEVVAVKAEDLEDLNVGLSGRTHSRVNTWHNVLMSMQKRTRDLVEEGERERCLEPFSMFG
ncbi:hypothetical protein LOK49_LG10G00292 [Camellia lanceoleosa]|uniref:Uncharacterized protein n=1 Tax=Camellia lanceoleosa TaxID=1840588 RepID=A0ACC0G5J1_9ERIC|nr:hypothetical protein LOK49_LG10G00292 [Camellia lanceoleosa]